MKRKRGRQSNAVSASNGLPDSNDPSLWPDQMVPLVQVTPCFCQEQWRQASLWGNRWWCSRKGMAWLVKPDPTCCLKAATAVVYNSGSEPGRFSFKLLIRAWFTLRMQIVTTKKNKTGRALWTGQNIQLAQKKKLHTQLWRFRLSKQMIPVPLEQTALPLSTIKPLNASDIWLAEVYFEFENYTIITAKVLYLEYWSDTLDVSHGIIHQ